ncbi:MAG: glycogen debranching enzyme N-terminal domain-containing protein [Desulfobulbaceae bacterium]|nr:glycogen debranching enzyme N-terminal domain-containing protein [Desulfobulbaceae bacterium]
MTIKLNETITQDLNAASRREWLESNGLGGWAGSTICGAHTRRYHGLLVAATRPPVGRMVLLSKLDETILCAGRRYELACNYYPGIVYPTGYNYLQSFAKDLFPRFTYSAGGIRVQKTIAAINGENTTLVLYEVLESPAPFVLELQPFVAYREYHGLAHANDSIQRHGHFQEGIFRVRPYDGVPELFISIPGAEFVPSPDWYFNYEYPVEQQRGLDFHEDLFTYGMFKLKLEAGQRIGIIISTRDPAGRDAFELRCREEKRRQDLLHFLPNRDDFPVMLTLAADQFLVQRSEKLRTIIAGYHWFTDWGRDTMIALPGITLVTGRHEDAGKILQAFARSVSQGMLPNRFPDANEEPEFNTVDASLWFFVAVHQYLQYTRDKVFVRDQLLPVLEEILSWHEKGTRYAIQVDTDGLLSAGEPGVQLTWMDAKIGDWVVTPRKGKAVEINALWYNALRIFSHLLHEFDRDQEAAAYEHRAALTKKRFNKVFWNQDGQYLYDYIDGNYKESAIRPNQVFAISLPFPLLSVKRSTMVLTVLEEKLLTPCGLRSLSPDHPDYRSRYEGDPLSRDSSYHQGTVWPWLLGPFVTALVRIRGKAGKKQAKTILEKMATHLGDAGVGAISEIFDADPPHTPRGCISQAWSVSELLRVYLEEVI